MEWILFLAAGVIAGLGIGWVAGSARTRRRRRRRDRAVDAELQAARQRAERATGEALALRARVEAEQLSGRGVAAEAELAAARAEVERLALLVTRLERGTAGSRRGEGRTRATGARPAVGPSPDGAGGKVETTVAGTAREPVAVGHGSPPMPVVAAMAPAGERSAAPEALEVPFLPVALVASPAKPTPRGASAVPVTTAPRPIVASRDATDLVPALVAPTEPSEALIMASVGPVTAAPAPEVNQPALGWLEVTRAGSTTGAWHRNGDSIVPRAASVTPVAPPASPLAAPDDAQKAGWRPLRPGLSDPCTWLGETSPSGVPFAEDDLQRVHGVGPYLARRLREEGIVTWRQLAELDEDDMIMVSRRIGSFPDRIRREDWPGSARALHESTYGERLP